MGRVWPKQTASEISISSATIEECVQSRHVAQTHSRNLERSCPGMQASMKRAVSINMESTKIICFNLVLGYSSQNRRGRSATTRVLNKRDTCTAKLLPRKLEGRNQQCHTVPYSAIGKEGHLVKNGEQQRTWNSCVSRYSRGGVSQPSPHGDDQAAQEAAVSKRHTKAVLAALSKQLHVVADCAGTSGAILYPALCTRSRQSCC